MSNCGKSMGVGQRLMQESCKKRMRTFIVLVKSVAFYGVEIYRWEKSEYLESLQKRYMK